VNEKRLYRNRQNGKILGVCAGLADFYGWPVGVVRFLWLVALFPFSFFSLLLYFGLGFFLPVKPDTPLQSAALDTTSEAALRQLNELEREYGVLNQRLSLLEDYVTSDHFNLHRKIWAMKE
jgi:phage shock protein C